MSKKAASGWAVTVKSEEIRLDVHQFKGGDALQKGCRFDCVIKPVGKPLKKLAASCHVSLN